MTWSAASSLFYRLASATKRTNYAGYNDSFVSPTTHCEESPYIYIRTFSFSFFISNFQIPSLLLPFFLVNISAIILSLLYFELVFLLRAAPATRKKLACEGFSFGCLLLMADARRSDHVFSSEVGIPSGLNRIKTPRVLLKEQPSSKPGELNESRTSKPSSNNKQKSVARGHGKKSGLSRESSNSFLLL